MKQELIAKIMAVLASSMLDRIADVESGHKFSAIGDKGLAHGAWQMHRAAWDDAKSLVRYSGLPPRDGWKFPGAAHDPERSRLAAAAYVVLLRGQFREVNKRDPSDFEVYVMWNLGFNGFRSHAFKTNKLTAKLLLNAAYVETGK